MYAQNCRKAKPLTEVQIEVLQYVKTYIADSGYPPTLQEICSWFGWASKRAASDVLVRLEAAGAVKLSVGKYRGIKVLP